MKIKLSITICCALIACPIFAKIPSFVGDLVARDLKGAGPVGHVGIATAPYYKMRPTEVLEAMDTIPHIQDNTIENFKSRTTYWGSKGGLLSPQSIESLTVANRIVKQYYACPEYSYTWRWKEGQIDFNSQPISCALFRCDTLVNYAYAFSKGYSLPTYDTTWTTPLAIFNYFPVESDLFIPEQHDKHPIAQNILNNNIESINENNLKQLNGANFYQILQNSPTISEEQIKYLWSLFTSNDVDKNVKILFYDFIAFEAPDYLTSEVIKQAKNERGELRHKLLVILQSIYQSKLEKHNKTNLSEIIDYFKALQLQDLDKNDGGIVYRGLAILTQEHLETRKANLINMDKIHVNILNLKRNRTNETEYVKDIIFNLDHPDDNLVITASYQYLTQLLINTDLNLFSNESKLLFKMHLDSKSVINHKQPMLYTSAYIEFKAALNSNKTEEIPILANLYMQALDPEIQKATFYGFTDFTKNKLKLINNFN